MRIEDLLDRRVVDARGTRLGRIHEIVARRRGDRFEVTEYRVGSGALLDRFQFTQWIFGRAPKTIAVRAEDLDIGRGSAPCIAHRHVETSD